MCSRKSNLFWYMCRELVHYSLVLVQLSFVHHALQYMVLFVPKLQCSHRKSHYRYAASSISKAKEGEGRTSLSTIKTIKFRSSPKTIVLTTSFMSCQFSNFKSILDDIQVSVVAIRTVSVVAIYSLWFNISSLRSSASGKKRWLQRSQTWF